MKAIIVCVNYSDFLSITLPYNRHHFSEVVVVTSFNDRETQQLAKRHGARILITDAFYDDGADFNKFKALEQGLSVMGRNGWICLLDADILWPKVLPKFTFTPGKLYTPDRRMMRELIGQIPHEPYWASFPRPQYKGFSGYTQIVHGSDPVLGSPPWHEVTGRHAGGADTKFQARWSEADKIRPPFEVLHLGPNKTNWRGRVSPRL